MHTLLIILAAATAMSVATTARAQNPGNRIYTANLSPVNEESSGHSPSARATLEILGENLIITVEGNGLPPNMMHLMHIHGYTDGIEAECADMAQDVNNDGIVDLIETEAVSGTTLIPFHDDPASLEIQTDTYPVADQQGNIKYKHEVPLNELRQAIRDRYGIDELDLANMVIYMHGVPDDTQLPESVRSLPDVPATVTLPVACGAVEPVADDGTMRVRGCDRCAD